MMTPREQQVARIDALCAIDLTAKIDPNPMPYWNNKVDRTPRSNP